MDKVEMPVWVRISGLVALVLLALFFRAVRVDEVFTPQGIAFIDPDCYTRMLRVEQLAQHPWKVVREQKFENHPSGIRSHATVPLDYLILATAVPLMPFTNDALAIAGALISPLLGLVLMAYLVWWSSRFFSPWVCAAVLLAYAGLPSLAWAQNVGRPDHQSLILSLITIGLTMEICIARWPENKRWQWCGGLAWGLALWTSLYEPLVLLGLVILVRLVTHRLVFFTGRRLWWAVLGAVLLLAFWVEGNPIVPTPPGFGGYLANWLGSIGEMHRLGPVSFTFWFGGWIWFLPVAVGLAVVLMKLDPKNLLLFAAATLLLAVLTCLQVRWSPFLALMLAIFVVPLFFHLPGRYWQLPVAVLFTLPIIIYHLQASGVRVSSTEQQDLRRVAQKIAKEGGGGILAPWWTSPTLAYFSKSPVVASSSHESIEGIVDSSRFYYSPGWPACEAILQKRKVRWVVMGDPGKVISQSLRVLGLAKYNEEEAMRIKDLSKLTAMRLYRAEAVPATLKLRAVIREFRLYEYVGLPAPSQP